MKCRFSQMLDKEVVSVVDGTRFGHVGDLELDLETGRIRTLVVPARFRLFTGSGAEHSFGWDSIRKIGTDIILVESTGRERVRGRKTQED